MIKLNTLVKPSYSDKNNIQKAHLRLLKVLNLMKRIERYMHF